MGIPEDIEFFERNLQELVVKYEQYFLGMEKRAPLKLLDDLERLSRKYTGLNLSNTMLKFKIGSLVSRLNSYKQYWERINRLMDEGKYSRDRFKMSLHEKGRLKAPEQDKAAAAIPESERIYREYIEARKACKLPVENITPEMIASTIEKNKPVIINKYKCDRVEFKVVIENGAPKIKARPGS